jgi:hypothetical protein
MAERRMFAKTIVLSDAFLDMPLSARCLYFTLGMLADDDGFVNAPRSIMRQCGASDDDARILLSKKFIIAFDSGVIVIKHWRINNYLRNDRYVETKYTEEKRSLSVEENGAYTISGMPADELPPPPTAKDIRKQVYKESDLPYSFEYKIRRAFSGKPCPVCGATMMYVDHGMHKPTIQHNIPISRGGKHELSNISVICSACNVSLQDTPTGELNNAEVIATWKEISGIPNDGIPSTVYPDKDRLGKDSKGNKSTGTHKFVPPTLEDVKAYCQERNNGVDPNKWYDHYLAVGWKVGKNPMKDWKAAVRKWEENKVVEYTENPEW